MYFDDPIYLDPSAFEVLMADTDQHRICWMYHDILSHPRIAGMFDQYAGKGASPREEWTTMAWVAAGCQEGSFYLLFKWYEDFYGPPQRSDLYYIEQERETIRVRYLDCDFETRLDRRGVAWGERFLARVSANATRFFGEIDFDSNPVGRILRLLASSPGRELDALDRYFGRRSDWEKSLQCATVSAYFRSIQAVQEILYSLVVSDGAAGGVNYMHTDDLLDLLRPISARVDEVRLPALADQFQRLAEGFFDTPNRAPYLTRGAGRLLSDRTDTGEIRWLKITGPSGRRLLRDLYAQCAPRAMWDVFYRWQGEIYFTVLRHPLSRDLRRGVYVLSRFEDQVGLDVTGMFWLENLSLGVAHLCQGDFFEELLDQLLSRAIREAALPAFRPRPENPVGGYSHLLKEAFDQYNRGFG